MPEVMVVIIHVERKLGRDFIRVGKVEDSRSTGAVGNAEGGIDLMGTI